MVSIVKADSADRRSSEIPGLDGARTHIRSKTVNVFYSKLGYIEINRDEESVFYVKHRGDERGHFIEQCFL